MPFRCFQGSRELYDAATRQRKHLVYLVRFPITTRIRFMKPHLRNLPHADSNLSSVGTTYGVKTAQDQRRGRDLFEKLGSSSHHEESTRGRRSNAKSNQRHLRHNDRDLSDNAHIRPYPRIPTLLRYMMITSQRRPSTKRLIVGLSKE